MHVIRLAVGRFVPVKAGSIPRSHASLDKTEIERGAVDIFTLEFAAGEDLSALKAVHQLR